MERIKDPLAWPLALDSLLMIECDKQLVKRLLKVLFLGFNQEIRLGGYQFRFLPEADFIKGGSKSPMVRTNNLAKNIAVKQSLSLTVNMDIKEFDKPERVKGGDIESLRDILMAITYPINAEDSSAPKLYFGIDRVESGEYENEFYLVAYNDRADLASSFGEVLPEYIAEFYGKHLLSKWFHPHEIPDATDKSDEVLFDIDDEGNFTGKWSTPDDLTWENLLNEDVGFNLEGKLD